MQVQGLFRRTAWRMDLFGNIYIGIHTKAPRGLSLGRFCVGRSAYIRRSFLEKILCEDDGLLARGTDGDDAERDACDLCHAL